MNGNNINIAVFNDLENNISGLKDCNKQLTEKASRLNEIVNEIRTNWENESGQDLQSILNNINGSINKLSTIEADIARYSTILGSYIASAKAAQRNTM